MLTKVVSCGHVGPPKVSLLRSRLLEIVSDEPLWLWVVGERVAQTPAVIEVLASAISLVAPG